MGLAVAHACALAQAHAGCPCPSHTQPPTCTPPGTTTTQRPARSSPTMLGLVMGRKPHLQPHRAEWFACERMRMRSCACCGATEGLDAPLMATLPMQRKCGACLWCRMARRAAAYSHHPRPHTSGRYGAPVALGSTASMRQGVARTERAWVSLWHAGAAPPMALKAAQHCRRLHSRHTGCSCCASACMLKAHATPHGCRCWSNSQSLAAQPMPRMGQPCAACKCSDSHSRHWTQGREHARAAPPARGWIRCQRQLALLRAVRSAAPKLRGAYGGPVGIRPGCGLGRGCCTGLL